MDPRQLPPTRRPAPDGLPARRPPDPMVQRYSILGGVLLCTLISALLGDSLVGVYRIDVGDAIPRGWRWLLGAAEQSFGTQTFALLLGVILLGFAFGGMWFLARTGLRMLREQLSGRPR